MKMYKLYIFDLDGVILNSKSNMEAAWKDVRLKYTLKNNFNAYFSLIGIPFIKILKKLGIKKNRKKIEKTYSEKSLKYIDKIKLYPKIKSVLNQLSIKSKIAVVTSKEKKRTYFLLKKFNLRFDAISCPEKGKRGKPYPDQLLKVIKKFKLHRKDCIYIGDMKVDFIAAKNAKIDFAWAQYGYEKKKLKKLNIIKKFEDLIK